MKTRGPKRKASHFPKHINPDDLPTGVGYIPKGDGFFRIAYTDDQGKRKFRRLCDGKASISQIWQAYEAKQERPVTTFKTLSLGFQKSTWWSDLAPITRKDYTDCHKRICAAKTKGGGASKLLADVPLSDWSQVVIRLYIDHRAQSSKSRANKELAYIKSVFNWGFNFGHIEVNFARGVKKLKTEPRQHYAKDTDFSFLVEAAKETNYWYVPYVLRLGFECRMRTVEILEMTDANETKDGLLIDRHKGSRDNITLWDDNLRQLWEDAKAVRNGIWAKRGQATPINPEDRHIFISAYTGNPINEDTYRTGKHRVSGYAKAKAERLGIPFTNFTTHDTKRKGITDTSQKDKKAASGLSEAMMKVYDVSVPKVKSTSESKKTK